ncbi:TPA: hypothetical protein ACMWW0_001967 [Legionella pneumophila]|nr:hypothetical protein [Legionella pneumophila]HCX3599069.1 hypothetical protein [Legionella pneumophila]HDI4841925.1 hypothetical protein [Legionella pneumophila]HDI4891204.1 hypothetical protein [Legionella pneumophila]HDI4897924.1 hypothetical protein [Legionella pneumophila]
MFKKNDNFYIALVQFGVDTFENGTTLDETKDYLSKKGYSHQSSSHFFNEIFHKLFAPHLHEAVFNQNLPEKLKNKFFIKPEAYFNLIQYKANRSTRNAFYVASISLIISAFPFVFNFYLYLKKIFC